MRVGYAVPIMPQLASYRLRVQIPSEHLGCDYAIGCTGKPTFFFKNGNVRLAEALQGVVYDVVNDHFHGKYAADYHGMCGIADKITVASERMAEVVLENTGRESTVIADPYENAEQPARCYGNGVTWFGHSANMGSLVPHLEAVEDAGGNMVVCSNTATSHVQWSRASEDQCLAGCAVALVTSSNAGASANRVVKALRAGRFVVAPKNCAESWRELAPYIWIGDVSEGIAWALHNREEACLKIQLGQQMVADRFSPELIGRQWTELFASI
jgi:hypothetical protein